MSMNKVSNNTMLAFKLLMLYPFINILVCYLLNGDGMNTLSVVCSYIFIVLNIKSGFKIKKDSIIVLAVVAVAVFISFIRERVFSNKVISLLYATTVIVLLCIKDGRIDLNIYGDLLLKKKKFYFMGQSMYFLVLLVNFMQHGLRSGWNTAVLQGPYNYPHTLAYILLFLLCGDAYLLLNRFEVVTVVFCGINGILVLLTAVRSVLVGLTIVALYIVWYYANHGYYKKILMILMIGILGIIIAWHKGLFDAFIAKTMLSVRGGFGLTNNRAATFISSIETYKHSGKLPFSLMIGTGLENMMKQNKMILGEAIHAHNDFIDVFVSYGLLNFLAYIYVFLKTCFKNTKRIGCFLFFGVLTFYNGLFVYIDCIPMMIIPVVLFNVSKRR